MILKTNLQGNSRATPPFVEPLFDIYCIYVYIYIYIHIYYESLCMYVIVSCILKHRNFVILAFVGRIHLFPSQRTSDVGVFRYDDVIMNVEFVLIFLFGWSKALDQFATKSVVFLRFNFATKLGGVKICYHSMLPTKCDLQCTKITWTEWLHIQICICMDKMCSISRRNMLQI